MKLFCVGISHHTANVETRERYAGGCSEDALRAAAGCREALMLTTCNRVEVYASAEQSVPTEGVLRALQQCGTGEIGVPQIGIIRAGSRPSPAGRFSRL